MSRTKQKYDYDLLQVVRDVIQRSAGLPPLEWAAGEARISQIETVIDEMSSSTVNHDKLIRQSSSKQTREDLPQWVKSIRKHIQIRSEQGIYKEDKKVLAEEIFRTQARNLSGTLYFCELFYSILENPLSIKVRDSEPDLLNDPVYGIDLQSGKIIFTHNGSDQAIQLTPLQQEIFKYLAEKRPNFVESKEIYEVCWSPGPDKTTAQKADGVKKMVQGIRKRFGNDSVIESAQNQGYRLRVQKQ